MEGEFIERLKACGVNTGDEVMVQTLAPVSLVEAVVALGAVPVFVDSEPQTGNMYAEQLRNGIRSRFAETGKMPKAIVPVSMCGKAYNKEYIAKVADRYEIPVVEYPAPASDFVPMPLHLMPEYSEYKAFVNGVAERIWEESKHKYFTKMEELSLKDALQAFIQAYLYNFNYGEKRKDYYCGITDNLDRRAKEHNATFIKTMKADTFEGAKELEQELHDAGFDTGAQVGNGNEDSVYIYMYKKIPGVTKE